METSDTPNAGDAVGNVGTIEQDALGMPLPSLNGDAPKRLDITRDEVAAADDHRIIVVPVDEWKPGASIYIHTPSAGDKDFFEREIVRAKDTDPVTGAVTPRAFEQDEVRAAFIAMCARNSAGERIFTGDDIKMLKAKSIVPMDRLYKAILDAMIITPEDVDTIAKNSGSVSSGI
jgi:hypothetical protein